MPYRCHTYAAVEGIVTHTAALRGGMVEMARSGKAAVFMPGQLLPGHRDRRDVLVVRIDGGERRAAWLAAGDAREREDASARREVLEVRGVESGAAGI